MTKIQRKTIREKIIAAVTEMTAEESNRNSVVTVGGHELSRRLIYAGGSQWCGCDRDWDSTESGWAWVVDDQYRLTTPDLFGFNGHNIIEVQTPYYLQDGYDEQTTPEHDGRDSMDQVPNAILIEIARGLVAAQNAAAAAEKQSAEAEEVIAKLA
jgi:hypothetical protein